MLRGTQLELFASYLNQRWETGYWFDYDNNLWGIDCEFKWSGFQEADLAEFLAYIIAEPCEITSNHDLWEAPHIVMVEPKPLPKPDWNRKIFEPYDP